MGFLDPVRSCFAFLIGALAVLVGRPGAATAEPAATTCRFEALSEQVAVTGRLKQIVDGRSFLLEDGREVRLAGIEVPLLSAAATDTTGQAAAQAARAALERLLTGAQLTFKRLGVESDRYGRLLAHVFVERDGGQIWLQRELVAQGHARVTARLDASCAKELLNAERTARAAGLGLWADAQFRARPAEKPEDILNERGRFAFVEGKVLSVRESGGIVYLNFGRRWTRDFAVTVLKRNERLFAAAGIELKKLEGRRVRIRGWVEERGGPRIEAQGPEQIEIADRN